MRVAISAHFWGQHTTGSGQYLHYLVETLRAHHAEIEPLLLLPATTNPALLPPNLDYRLVKTPFDTRSRQMAKLWFEQVSVPQAAAAAHADLLHIPYFAPPLRAAMPVVATIHDLIPMVLPAYRGSALVRGYTALVARAARRTTLILADSDASRQDILALLKVAPARVQTVYLAADRAYQPQSAAAIDAVRAKYNLPDDFVLYLGGFDVRKQVSALLRATAQSSQAWKLVIAGKVPSRDSDFFPNPERIARELNLGERVQFAGWVEEADKPALLAAATVFAFPSAYEGFGLPILEAMACGTATITTNISSLPELAGDGAYLVPPHETDALQQALDTFMSEPRKRVELAERGKAQAMRFSWERCVRETVAGYHQAIQTVAVPH